MHHPGGRRARIVDSYEAAEAMLAPLFARAREERLYVAHLSADHRLLGFRMRFGAEAERIDFSVRAIVADALALGSAGLILAHNHPSGDPTPSSADLDATRSLMQVTRTLNIAVRDHLVFGGTSVLSFRKRGLL